MHRYLLAKMAASTAIATLVCLAIGSFAASVRLLPWIAAESVPTRAAWAFAQALLLAAVEVALLLAPPVGISVLMARLTADGSWVALQSLGVGPARVSVHAGLVAAAAAALSLGASSLWGLQARDPGLLSNELLDAGRQVCAAPGPREVPLVGVSWLCLQQQPRIAGRIGSGTNAGLAWTASSASFSPDLTAVTLSDVTALAPDSDLRMRLGDVTVTGFVPWLVASPAGALARGLGCALACWASAVAATWTLLVRSSTSRVRALAVGSSGPVAFVLFGPQILARGVAMGTLITLIVCLSVPMALGWAAAGIQLLAGLRDGTTH
jgi:hypothetical protein